jgi:MFS-type transporter involved in bile tolerance (Atg22 family)
MTVYNKPLIYIGFMIFVVGGIIDYYNENQTIATIFQIVGIVVMLFAFRKPKGERKEQVDN